MQLGIVESFNDFIYNCAINHFEEIIFFYNQIQYVEGLNV